MVTKDNAPIAAAAPDGTTPLTPEQIVEQLRILRQHVPDFGPLSLPSAKALRTTAKVPDDFVLASINTIGASPAIAQALASDAPALLAQREDAGRWSAVEDELGTMFTGVAAANLGRRHRIGLAALQAYSIARQLVRKKEHADLLPHVENMRRTNRFGRPRTNPPAAPPATPTPPVTPAPPTPPPVPKSA